MIDIFSSDFSDFFLECAGVVHWFVALILRKAVAPAEANNVPQAAVEWKGTVRC